MSATAMKLSGPDLSQGVELSAIPDGAMLLGHVGEEPVLICAPRRRTVRDWRYLHALRRPA